MTAITFTIPGQPVGKGRPIAGRSFGGHVTLRTPTKTISYESLVGLAAHQAMNGRDLLGGAVEVAIRLSLQIPASWSKKKRADAIAKRIRPTTKPDMDNVIKAIFDAMNGVVWNDDAQVVDLAVAKEYAENPSAWVRVVPAEVA